ncbi:hypothetical protein [Fischerella sp. PCC 9605]|uniref:hypothetical protein n=1 Tax=Fischerella sp. PCC 9605 TaxID=1173024 RepID=UPI0012DEF053|nr:hypothetical protein [Fischerella sp. PCC 9605]
MPVLTVRTQDKYTSSSLTSFANKVSFMHNGWRSPPVGLLSRNTLRKAYVARIVRDGVSGMFSRSAIATDEYAQQKHSVAFD